MVENQQLKEIQNIEYEALISICKICEENNLKVYLRGGSVLGAVKYKGFVPWDDDIDIALPREDYLKLIDIMPQNFDNKFQFISYQKVNNAHCYFPRILLNEDIRRKMNFPKNNERGLVLIDVLPLDGMPDSKIGQMFFIGKIYLYRILASLWTIDVKDTVSMHDSKKEKILKLLYSLKIHHLYKQDTIYKKLDKSYGKYNFGKTKKACILSSSKLTKEIVPTEWWGKGKFLKFNSLEVRVPYDYDNYLKRLFGDNYKTYEPSIELRTKSHINGNGGN